ncbi:MAG: ABC transporter ATP-binding protein [Myxococcales bacterium]|nr:ABC transporter ATP-binding protein [Myxococcales bacterium]MCB9708557.1 ABC transporter ATP-binding protein [Myxococcales bacterium]
MSANQDWRLLGRLAHVVKPHWRAVAGALALMPLGAVLMLYQPLLIKRAIDAVVVHKDLNILVQVAGLYLAVIVGDAVGKFAQIYLVQLAGQRSMAELRAKVYSHIQRLHMGIYDRTPVGRLVTRVTNDIDALGEFFGSGAVTAFADVFALIGIVVFMLYLDWRLSLFAFAVLPPMAVMIEWCRRQLRSAFRIVRAKIAELNAYLAEQVQGIFTVQAYGRQLACQAEFETINNEYRQASYTTIRYDALMYSVVEAASTVCVAVVLWYAAVRVGWLDDQGAGASYIGTVAAFYEYLQRFFVPVRDLSTKYTVIQQSMAAAERVFGVLDVAELDVPSAGSRDIHIEGDSDSVVVEFEDVSFAYRTDQPVLHEVSFQVRRGETVALVGATASGKTTVLSLLLRLYDNAAGLITVTGRDIRKLDPQALRRFFAYVPQDVVLFSGTLLDNVALGDPAPDSARAAHALNSVGFLKRRDRRIDLSEPVIARGANFSLGERQLIAFARAMYRDAACVILDEATASMDSDTEARLQQASESIMQGRTSLVVAHRLSTVEKADRIVVFHKGRVLEQGRHAQLLAQKGVYAKLHRLHFSDEAF